MLMAWCTRNQSHGLDTGLRPATHQIPDVLKACMQAKLCAIKICWYFSSGGPAVTRSL